MLESNIKLNFSFLEILIFIKKVGCIDRSYMKAQVKIKEKTSQIFYQPKMFSRPRHQISSLVEFSSMTVMLNHRRGKYNSKRVAPNI